MTKEEIERIETARQPVFANAKISRLESENERLKVERFTLEDIERSFNAGVNSQFEVKALNKNDILDFHARKLHQLVLSIKPPKQ